MLRDLMAAIHAQPEAMRRWIIADLRSAADIADPTPPPDEQQER
jgi:hypothetical protein